jgi:hypothetical protein
MAVLVRHVQDLSWSPHKQLRRSYGVNRRVGRDGQNKQADGDSGKKPEFQYHKTFSIQHENNPSFVPQTVLAVARDSIIGD